MTTRPTAPNTNEEQAPSGRVSKTATEEQAWEAIGFAQFPIVTTSIRRPATDTLEFEENATIGGRAVARRWKMVASREYGLPRLYDLDLFIAFLVLAQRHSYETRLIKTTLHELCAIPGLTPGGATYERVKAGTRRFVHTGYSSMGAFWVDRASEPIELEDCHILAEQRLLPSYQDPAIRDGLPASYILLGEKFLNLLKTSAVKPVDLALWRELGNGIIKPMFHFLDQGLYDRDRFEIGLYRLGRHIGETRYYAPSHAMRHYRQYLDRLVDLQFLHSFEFLKAKSAGDPYKIVVFPGPRARKKGATRLPSYQQPAKVASDERIAPRKATPESNLDQLVAYFSLRQLGIEKSRATAGERKSAEAILEHAGGDLDTARDIIDFAIAEAKRTEFDMRNVAAVLTNSYPERAMAARVEQESRRVRAEKHRAEQQALEAERQTMTDRARDEFYALPRERREEFVAEQRKKLRPFIERAPDQWTPDKIEASALHGYVSHALEAWAKERFMRTNQPHTPTPK